MKEAVKADDKATHHEHRLTVAEAQPFFSYPKPKPLKAGRLASLDIFRGLTVSLMILVDDAGDEWPVIGHAPWDGCNLADFVTPFFLFIVGMAIPLAFKTFLSRWRSTKKVIFRTLKLLFWGIILQGGFSHAPDELTYGVDIKEIRWCGVLQRIAFVYIILALMEILTKVEENPIDPPPPSLFSVFKLYCWHWLVGACVLVFYLAATHGIFVPDWQFTILNKDSTDYGKIYNVDCNVRGQLDPPCNAAGYIDRTFLGLSHMSQNPAWRRSKVCTENSPFLGPFLLDAPSWCYAPFESAGILSSISAILSTIIGVHFGHVLVHLEDHASRLKQWILMGFALLILGCILHLCHVVPINKQLYSFSYVCITSGSAALVFSTIYILVDVWNLKWLFLPFQWIGMNAMLVYVMAAKGIFAGFVNGWYYDDPHNSLIYWIKKNVFIGAWNSQRVGTLLYVIFVEIFFWAIISGIFHSQGIYWKL